MGNDDRRRREGQANKVSLLPVFGYTECADKPMARSWFREATGDGRNRTPLRRGAADIVDVPQIGVRPVLYEASRKNGASV
jgi:hypothetical protein